MRPKFKKLVILAVIIFWVVAAYIIMFGTQSTTDVSTDKKLWGEYLYQNNYILLRDVFLKRSFQGMARWGRLVLVPEASLKGHPGRHESSPQTIAEYEANPKTTFGVVGIVRKGTHLRTIRLDKHKGWSWFYGNVQELTPYMEILDGEYAGKIVDITDISIYYKEDSENIFIYRPENGVISLNDSSKNIQ